MVMLFDQTALSLVRNKSHSPQIVSNFLGAV